MMHANGTIDLILLGAKTLPAHINTTMHRPPRPVHGYGHGHHRPILRTAQPSMMHAVLAIAAKAAHTLTLAHLVQRPPTSTLARPLVPPSLAAASTALLSSWLLTSASQSGNSHPPPTTSWIKHTLPCGIIAAIGSMAQARAHAAIGDPASFSMALIGHVATSAIGVPLVGLLSRRNQVAGLTAVLFVAFVLAFWLSDPAWHAIVGAGESIAHMAVASFATALVEGFWWQPHSQIEADPLGLVRTFSSMRGGKGHGGGGGGGSGAHDDGGANNPWPLVTTANIASAVSFATFLLFDFRPFSIQFAFAAYLPVIPLALLGIFSALTRLLDPYPLEVIDSVVIAPASAVLLPDPATHIRRTLADVLAVMVAWSTCMVYDGAFAAIRIVFLVLSALVVLAYYLQSRNQPTLDSSYRRDSDPSILPISPTTSAARRISRSASSSLILDSSRTTPGSPREIQVSAMQSLLASPPTAGPRPGLFRTLSGSSISSGGSTTSWSLHRFTLASAVLFSAAYMVTYYAPNNSLTSPPRTLTLTLMPDSKARVSTLASPGRPLVFHNVTEPFTSTFPASTELAVLVPPLSSLTGRPSDPPPLPATTSISWPNISIAIGTYPSASRRTSLLTTLFTSSSPAIQWTPYWSTWDDPLATPNHLPTSPSTASPAQQLAHAHLGRYPIAIDADPASAAKSPHVKWFRMLFDSLRRAPASAQWFVLADDDTVLIPHKLLSLIQTQHADPTREPIYIGSISEVPHQAGEFANVAFGGAGVIVSRYLAERLAPHELACVREFAGEYGGDGRVRRCIDYAIARDAELRARAKGNIRLVRANALNQMDLWDVRDVRRYLRAKLARDAPATLHHYDVYRPLAGAGELSVDEAVALVANVALAVDPTVAFRRMVVRHRDRRVRVSVTYGLAVVVEWDWDGQDDGDVDDEVDLVAMGMGDKGEEVSASGQGWPWKWARGRGRRQEFWIREWSFARGWMEYVDEETGDRVRIRCAARAGGVGAGLARLCAGE
ncbi:hypothetical protein BCR44DRAFT_1441914 [Catenaria anguillulae PL171]|uniref:Glycosyltransferase family 31 protein n=1 Tax=Catenaria anguillulae PL171 TaxID=765915 RepID=A0A1Y2HCD4_9FUNG|nr:hypothetical protein BCR44DRAFT_1441914 [Catenaria anguillulae PL171]